MRWVGKRGEAFFDAWTLVHLAFWFMVGANMEQLGWPYSTRAALVAIGAIAWELFETWLDEHTMLEMTKESWTNRWISDPIMAGVGSVLGMWAIAS